MADGTRGRRGTGRACDSDGRRPRRRCARVRHTSPGAAFTCVGARTYGSRSHVVLRGSASSMLVRFHGVRGSTPCHGDDIARYGGNTSCVSVDVAGEDPLLFDLGTGLRYFGLTLPDRRAVPRARACSATCTGTTCRACRSSGRCCTPTASSSSTARREDDGRTAAEVLAATICPPLFPIGLDGFPGHVEVREPAAKFRIGGFDVESDAVPARRRGARLPRHARRRRASPTSATTSSRVGGPRIADGVWSLCQGVDLLIHDAQYTPAEFAKKSDVGPLHGRVRRVAGRRGRGQAAGAVPPRPEPRRRHARPARRRPPAAAARTWGSRCSPPARDWSSSSAAS